MTKDEILFESHDRMSKAVRQFDGLSIKYGLDLSDSELSRFVKMITSDKILMSADDYAVAFKSLHDMWAYDVVVKMVSQIE